MSIVRRVHPDTGRPQWRSPTCDVWHADKYTCNYEKLRKFRQDLPFADRNAYIRAWRQAEQWAIAKYADHRLKVTCRRCKKMLRRM